MKRDILTRKARCWPIPMDNFGNYPIHWLSQQMQKHQLEYLLAHADDGVIWGRLHNGELVTSNTLDPEKFPLLREKTLQMARIFAPAGELLVWRNEDGNWSGRLIAEITESNTTDEQANHPSTEPALSDHTDEWDEAFEEQQILLGTNAKLLDDRGFALMSEGSEGLFYVVPLKLEGKIDEQIRPLRLVVRHYLKEDDSGFLRVNASRLVNLYLKPEESNV